MCPINCFATSFLQNSFSRTSFAARWTPIVLLSGDFQGGSWWGWCRWSRRDFPSFFFFFRHFFFLAFRRFFFFFFLRFFFVFLRFSLVLLEDKGNAAIYCKNGEFHSDPVCTDPIQNFPNFVYAQIRTGERGHYERGLFTGAISRISAISSFSGISRKWTGSPLFSTVSGFSKLRFLYQTVGEIETSTKSFLGPQNLSFWNPPPPPNGARVKARFWRFP